MTKEKVKAEIERVLKSYGFKIIQKAKINGYLSLVDNDKLYVWCQCTKEIEDSISETPKKQKLMCRFSVSIPPYKWNVNNNIEIAFDYVNGGNSGTTIERIEDVEERIRRSFRCHNLYSYEELDALKLPTCEQLDIFDIIGDD